MKRLVGLLSSISSGTSSFLGEALLCMLNKEMSIFKVVYIDCRDQCSFGI